MGQARAPATRGRAGVPGSGRQRRDRQDVGRDVVHAALGARRGQGGALAHHLRLGVGDLRLGIGHHLRDSTRTIKQELDAIENCARCSTGATTLTFAFAKLKASLGVASLQK